MSDGPLQVGDRVITMQMPGIFTVTARAGRGLQITSDEGVMLTVAEASLRRMPSEPPPETESASTD